MSILNSIKRVLITIAESDPTQRTYLSQLFHRRRYRVLTSILKILSKGYIESLLDVGCGKGHLYSMLQHEGVEVVSYICLDIDYLKLSRGEDLKLCADAHQLPIASHSIEYTVVSEVLEHLKNPFITLNEVLRVTKRYLIITFPDERVKDSLGFRYLEHISRIDTNEVLMLVRKRGFDIIAHLRLRYPIPPSFYDKFLPFNKTLLRLLESFQRNLERVFKELCLIKTEVVVLTKVKQH